MPLKKHRPKRKLFLTCAVVAISSLGVIARAFSQSGQTKAVTDVHRAKELLAKAHIVLNTDTRAALKLVLQAKDLCRTLKIDSLTARAYNEEAYCDYYSGSYKGAAMHFDSAARFWKKSDRQNYFKALNDKGTALMYNSEYHEALRTYFDCLSISNSKQDKVAIGKILDNIGLVYESLHDADNALLYEKKSLPYKLSGNSLLSLANTYGNIGDAFALKAMHDSSIFYERKSYYLYVKLNDQEGMSNSLGNIGNTFWQKKLPDSALKYLLRAVAIAKKLSHAENLANYENNLGEDYLETGQLNLAKKYAFMAEAYVPQITDNEFLQEHFELMYNYFKKTGNTAQAFKYLEKLKPVNDSIFKEKINIQNEKISFEYEYKQKLLKDSLAFQSHLNASEKKATANRNRLYVSLLLFLIAGLLAVIWFIRGKLLERKNTLARQTAVLQEQKIKELENEKQILASQAVLKGQEEERSRLAKDLHDGLGGLLTGVKHSMINMKDNLIISSNNAEAFERSLNLIDTAMRELRRVAHNMMPEALAKFGLEEALKDYCASASTAAFKIIFQSFGSEIPVDKASEVTIYRIIQELVNNALKHSDATQIIVQMVKGDDWLTLSVEDNGKGFDTEELATSTGAGWGNVRNRVDYLNGNIDIRSQKGTGTSVNIEVKIPQK